MEKELKVSIIVTVYNTEQYLDKCISSIIDQSYTNIEIVLVDDGSTDNSYIACKKYVANDSRIILVHQENMGAVSARNVGIKHASGEYITFVDSDDYIDIDAIETVVRKIDDSLPDIVAYGLKEEYENHTVIKDNKYSKKLYNREEIEMFIFPTMISYGEFFDFGVLPNLVCKMIKKSFLMTAVLEVSEMVTVGDDADVVFQLMLQADSVQIIESNYYHYYKRMNSLMTQTVNDEMIIALYNDLLNSIEHFNLESVMYSQLKRYITFLKLLKNPQGIETINAFFNNNKQIALYGAGGFGQILQEQFGNQIVLWVDKDYERYRKCGMKVDAPQCLQEDYDYEIIFVAVLNTDICREISREIFKYGINKEVKFYIYSDDE